MSIRLRLTLLYSAILALTLITFSVGLYLALQQAMYNVVENTLKAEAQRLIESNPVQFDARTWQSQKFADAPLYAQRCNLDGSLVDRTPNLRTADRTLPLSPRVFDAVQRGKPVTERVAIDENTRLLVYSTPVKDREHRTSILQVAQSLRNEDRTLEALRTGMAVGGSIVTLLAFGVGWVLAGTALRPINRITQTARAIGSERDFSRRVAYTGPRDEVGRLATTFNTMLTELQAAYATVEQALQAQRRFVADASHELRTPLTTIRGNLGLLQRRPPISPSDRDASLTDMVDETERMSRLVNDLLTLARTDAGRPLRSEPVPIKPLIEDLCRQAKVLAPELTIMCDNIPDVAILGDGDALKQVLLILLDNARKFTPAGGTVAITTTAADKQVAISIRDAGPGIAPEMLPHIFERFYRGDAARTGGGAGLGLAIAKALVEAQHSTIAATSEVGQGSMFTTTLPQAPMRDV